MCKQASIVSYYRGVIREACSCAAIADGPERFARVCFQTVSPPVWPTQLLLHHLPLKAANRSAEMIKQRKTYRDFVVRFTATWGSGGSGGGVAGGHVQK